MAGDDEEIVLEKAGKPLAELTKEEASALLHEYTERVKEMRSRDEAERPPGTRRKRAHLPEGVDEFEMSYLQACQDEEVTVNFTLLNGREFAGRIMGFSPYYITVREEEGTETTIHKLALAYYRRAPAEEELA